MSIKKHVDLLDRLAYVLNGQHTWNDYTDVTHTTTVQKAPTERSKKRFKWVKKLLLVLVLLIESGCKHIKSLFLLRPKNTSKSMDGENRMRE